MAKLRSYDFRCFKCPHAPEIPDGHTGGDLDFDAIVRIEDDETFEMPECPGCGTAIDVIKIPSAPMVLKATFPDGRKRQDAWYIGKEAADIRKSGFGKSPKKRNETEKQARALEGEAHKRFKPERQ